MKSIDYKKLMDKIRLSFALLLLLFLPAKSVIAAVPEEIKVDWRKIERVSKKTVSQKVVMTVP